MATSNRLFDDLTNLPRSNGSDVPAAVELSHLLLRAVAMEACGATCNAQVMYRLTSRAREIADEIIGLMDEVDSASKIEEGRKAFDKYTRMIDPLEDELFNVVCLPPRDDHDNSIKIASDTTLIAPYKNWEADREAVQAAYKALYKSPLASSNAAIPADFTAASKYDDISCLLSAVHHLEEYDAEDNEDLDYALGEIRGGYKDLIRALRQSDPYDQTAGLLGIRSAFVLSGLLVRQTIPAVQRLQKGFWTTEEPWKKATDIVAELVVAIRTQSRTKLDEAVTNWEAFEAYLMSGMPKDELLERVGRLMSLARSIRRPYAAQAYKLINQCFELESVTRATDGTASPRDLKLLNKVVQAAEDFLKAAKDDDTAGKGISWDDITKREAFSKFEIAKGLISQGLVKHGKEDRATGELEEARKRDKQSVSRMWGVDSSGKDEGGEAAKHASIKQKATAERDKLTVSVTVIQANAPRQASRLKFDLEGLETLDSILWKIHIAYKIDVLSRNPRFIANAEKPDEELDSHTTLSSLDEDDSSTVEVLLLLDDISGFPPASSSSGGGPGPTRPAPDRPGPGKPPRPPPPTSGGPRQPSYDPNRGGRGSSTGQQQQSQQTTPPSQTRPIQQHDESPGSENSWTAVGSTNPNRDSRGAPSTSSPVPSRPPQLAAADPSGRVMSPQTRLSSGLEPEFSAGALYTPRPSGNVGQTGSGNFQVQQLQQQQQQQQQQPPPPPQGRRRLF